MNQKHTPVNFENLAKILPMTFGTCILVMLGVNFFEYVQGRSSIWGPVTLLVYIIYNVTIDLVLIKTNFTKETKDKIAWARAISIFGFGGMVGLNPDFLPYQIHIFFQIAVVATVVSSGNWGKSSKTPVLTIQGLFLIEFLFVSHHRGFWDFSDSRALGIYVIEFMSVALIGLFFSKVTQLFEDAFFEITDAKRQLQNAQEIAKIGYFSFDFVTNTGVSSDETYKIYGYDPKGPPLTTEMRLARYAPGDREIAMNAKARMHKTGK